jgi:pyridinium-3,5-biscarboxylic acid mononucleotide synthase
MQAERLRALLEEVRSGSVPVEAALNSLRDLPYEDIGFARVDHHRSLRTGFPEVIFCPGKTHEQIAEIAARILARGSKVLATRAIPEVASALAERFPTLVYHDCARIMVVPAEAPVEPPATAGCVLVLAAGTADLPVAEEAAVTVSEMGSPVERLYDVGVAGLHRLLDQRNALTSANVLVVVAGMEGALPSVVGGLVSRPVIAVPTSVGYGANFGGLAPLLAMLNTCAAGVTVVNIDNGFGAGYFAHLVNVSPEGRTNPACAG